MGRTVTGLIWGFIIGALFTVVISATREDKRSVEPSDLVKSYEKGFQDALNAERPSDRLEYVCAALWFKGGEK